MRFLAAKPCSRNEERSIIEDDAVEIQGHDAVMIMKGCKIFFNEFIAHPSAKQLWQNDPCRKVAD